MQLVNIEFHNIQSHANTKFKLGPGLNFILADDNNVGKSTIFKTLTIIVRMPEVSADDLRELLRVGESSGYASFDLDKARVTFWMFRSSDDKIRAFFETKYDDDQNVRALACPKELIEALDLVRGDDGFPINFNDADSIQLIVQDTLKNDEILAKVLIDQDVERIKGNSAKLSKQIFQDYRLYKSRYDDADSLLRDLHYNDFVDSYYDDESTMLAATRILDLLKPQCSFSEDKSQNIDFGDFSLFCCAVRVFGILSDFSLHSFEESQVCDEDLDILSKALKVLIDLSIFDVNLLQTVIPVTALQLENASRAIDVLNHLQRAEYSCYSIKQLYRQEDSMQREYSDIMAELQRDFTIVKCPIRGDVYYNSGNCIKVN